MTEDREFSWEKEKTVGSHVYEILSKSQPDFEVGEIIEQYTRNYLKALYEAFEVGLKEDLEDPFHIIVLHKKESWAVNVVRNWFVTRQTCPDAQSMWFHYPNFMHTVYKAHKKREDMELLWTLPSPQEARTVLNNSSLYDPHLCLWIERAFKKLPIV